MQKVSQQRQEMLCPIIEQAIESFYTKEDPPDTTRKLIYSAISRYQEYDGNDKAYIFPLDSIESLYRYLGHLAFREKKYDEAIGHYHRGAKLNTIGPHTYIEKSTQRADYYFYIAWMCFAQGKMDSSLKYYSWHVKELTLLDSLHPSLEETYNNLGLIYYNKEDYFTSIQCFLQSINILIQNQQDNQTDESLAVTLRNIGSCLFEMERYNEVKSVMNFVHEFLTLHNPVDLYKYNQLMALSYLKTFELDSAMIHFKKSDSLLPYIKNNYQKFQHYVNYCSFYLANNELGKAKSTIWKLNQMFDNKTIDGTLFNIRNHVIQSKYFETANKTNLAINHLKLAIKEDKQTSDTVISFPTIYVENLFKLAELQYKKYKECNDYNYLAQSNSNYKRAFEYNKISISNIKTDQSKILYKEYLYNYYKQYITQLIRNYVCIQKNECHSNVLEDIVVVSDFCKYSILHNSTSVAKNERLKTSQKQLFEFLNVIQSSKKQIAKRIYINKNQLIKTIIQKKNKPKYSGQSPSNIQKELYQDEIILNYILSEDSLYCNLITKDTVTLIAIHNIDSISSQIISLNASIKKYQNTLLLNQSIGRVSKTILYPIKDLFTNKHLVYIISEGIISELPFDCLILNNQYLIENHIIRECLSLSGWKRKQNVKFSHSTISGFAPVASLSKTNKHTSLPFSRKEIIACTNIIKHKSKSTYTYIDKKASTENFHNAFTSSEFIHISSHLYKGDKNNSHPYLLLNQKGTPKRFYQWDIINKNIKTTHLVLSTCSSGFGEKYKSEGIDSFVRSFYMLGIKNIIYTRWGLEDEFASIFFPLYYKNLLDTKNPTLALQLTKIHCINSSNYSHPFFWASINCI